MKQLTLFNIRTLRLFIAMVWILLTAIAANAQTVLTNFDGFDTNGTVRSIEYDDANELIYIGGDFTHVGERYQYGAAVDGTSNVIANYPAVDGIVYATYPDGAGGFYIGGDFTTVGAERRSNLAYIDASGNVTSWDPSADGTVRTILYDGSTVYVGGDFNTIGGVSRSNLVAIDPSSGSPTKWNPSPNNRVRTITSDGTNIYVGGDFTLIGSDARLRLAAFDIATHLLLAWAPEANSSVYAMVMNGSDIYVGGNFTEIDGTSRSRLASITTSGTLNSWDPNAVGGVFALRIQGSFLYVGGSFNTISSASRSKIASFDLSNGSLRAWNPGSFGIVNSITSTTTDLYVGSTFGFEVLDLSTGADIVFDVGWTGICNTIAISGSNVYLGGSGKLGGEKRSGLAAIDASTGDVASWAPNPDGTIYDLVLNGSEIIAGGDYDNIGGEARANLAAVNLSTGLASSWDLDPTGLIFTLLKSGDELYVGGSFTAGVNGSGFSRRNLVLIDLATGDLDLSWLPDPDDKVNSIALSDNNTLYVGGNFQEMDGVFRPHMVEIDLTTANLTTWSPSVNNEVNAIAVDGDGIVYAGGRFTSVGGSSRSKLAAIDPSTGLATTWDPSPSSTVNNISIFGDIIYVGGGFSSILGENRRAFAAISSNESLLDWTFEFGSANGNAIFQNGLNVYVGGNGFTLGDDHFVGFTAVSRPNGSPLDIELSSNTINENRSPGELVGSFTSTDDNGDAHTYTLVSGDGDEDNDSFSISGENLLSAEAFDFETKDSYSIRIRSEDNNGFGREEEYTITINNVIEKANTILAFSLAEQIVPATIDIPNKTVTINVNHTADITSLLPTLEVSSGATYTPSGAQDFSSSVNYTVTAENGTDQIWSVSVNAPIPSGTYTVGSGGDYSNFTNAVNDLNNNGISGDVTLEILNSQSTAAPFTITNYFGSSDHTLTIVPTAGPSSITFTGRLELQGVENITIDGMGVLEFSADFVSLLIESDGSNIPEAITVRNSQFTSRTGIWITDGNNITIDGNVTRGLPISGAAQIYRFYGIALTNNTQLNNLTIQNNDILFGQEFNPSSIQSSVFGIAQTTSTSITGYFRVYNNTIRLNPAQAKGIIRGLGATADDLEIYHNTILLEGGDGSTLNAECISASATNSVLIKNNILDVNVTQTGTSASISQLGIKLADSSIPTVEMEDNNITFLNADRLYDGYFRLDLGIALDDDDLSTIETSFPGTTYSDVTFVDRDNNDYELDGTSLDDLDLRGEFIASVATDINGTSRSTYAPSKGAIEAPFNFIVWNGTTWSNGTGPGAGSDDVIIDGDYSMGTDGYFDSRDLTINVGATMTVDGESTLAVQRDLINNGSIIVESGSSLMVNSPNTITGNDITFKRNTRYADGRYSFVGSPVEQDVSIVGSDLGSHVYKYNETTAYGADGINRWEDASADELIPGKGYTQAFQQEIVFLGMPNQGTIIIDGTFTDVADPDHEGWVLVSNPYPAPIDVADFLSGNTNTTGTIYIWDDNGSDTQRGTNADYIVANGSMVTNTTPTPAGGASRYDQIMGSMQGFFVKLTSAADVEIEFREDMRVTGNSDDHFFRKTQIPIARINLTSHDGLFRQAVIGLAEDANNTELNRTYDAQPFSAIASDGLFTIKEGRSLSLNGMTKDWEVIQLQVNTSMAGNYEIAVELEAYDQSLYLRDNFTGEVTDLRNESYSFSAQSGINTDRFELLSSPSGVLGVENNALLVYAHQSILHIHQQDDKVREYQLFNMNGQKLLTQSVKGKVEINVSSYSKGIYLIFDGEKTHKIILK